MTYSVPEYPDLDNVEISQNGPGIVYLSSSLLNKYKITYSCHKHGEISGVESYMISAEDEYKPLCPKCNYEFFISNGVSILERKVEKITNET